MLHVTAAEYLGGYRVWVAFDDGASGDVDLSGRFHGPVFEPLRDVALFSQVRFDPEADTIVWPNGADLAPEYLRDLISVASPAPAKAS
jgi:malonyl CoA-acyl carrier protein transacylase